MHIKGVCKFLNFYNTGLTYDKQCPLMIGYIVPERKVHSGTILDCGLRILDWKHQVILGSWNCLSKIQTFYSEVFGQALYNLSTKARQLKPQYRFTGSYWSYYCLSVCNYPGCQVQGSLFRGSTRTEPLYMRRALNWLRKNPGLTVQS